MFSKVAKIMSNAVLTLIDLFQNSTKVNNLFGLPLRANLFPRTFKNRTIWSHCQAHYNSKNISCSRQTCSSVGQADSERLDSAEDVPTRFTGTPELRRRRGLEAARSLQGPDLGRELVGKRRTESLNYGNISITLPNLL